MVRCRIWIGTRRNFPMNIPDYRFVLLFLCFITYMEPAMAFFFKKNLNTAEFVEFVGVVREKGD